MFSAEPIVESRRALYARLASRVLETLNEAVDRRTAAGKTKHEIAERIGCHRSQLSRILNGTTPNLTLKTIADVLWATDHDPADFHADPLEDLQPNCATFDDEDRNYHNLWSTIRPYRESLIVRSSSDWAFHPKVNATWQVEVSS